MPDEAAGDEGQASLKSSTFHIDGSVESCELTEQIRTSGTAIDGGSDIKPDPQRHQRRAETGETRDETAGERASQQDRVGGRVQIFTSRHSGASKDETRNLEIPGLVLRTIPE